MLTDAAGILLEVFVLFVLPVFAVSAPTSVLVFWLMARWSRRGGR